MFMLRRRNSFPPSRYREICWVNSFKSRMITITAEKLAGKRQTHALPQMLHKSFCNERFPCEEYANPMAQPQMNMLRLWLFSGWCKKYLKFILSLLSPLFYRTIDFWRYYPLNSRWAWHSSAPACIPAVSPGKENNNNLIQFNYINATSQPKNPFYAFYFYYLPLLLFITLSEKLIAA